MASILLSAALSVVVGLVVWRTAGSRLALNEQLQANDALNIVVYITIGFAILFPVVFFVIG